MKNILYKQIDFPNGFDAELLRQQLFINHNQLFQLSTAIDSVNLVIDEVIDNEVAIRATCVAHFTLTKAQRDAAILDAQTILVLQNGDQFRRFLLQILFDLESRIRVLEAKPAITKVQYLTALRNIYKTA